MLLSSEIIPGSSSLADPKESCTRLQAKTFRVEKIFCYINFFVHQSAAIIKFQLRDIFNWDRREPLENCTSLVVNMDKNGITYSQCQRRMYFVCVQGKAVVFKKVSMCQCVVLNKNVWLAAWPKLPNIISRTIIFCDYGRENSIISRERLLDVLK